MSDAAGYSNDQYASTNGGGRARSSSPRRESRARSRSPNRMDTRGDGEKAGPSLNPGNNLHVSGLSSKVDDEDLIEAFSKYGKVAKAQVMRDPQTRDSRGFGFVTMDTPEEGDAALNGMNAQELKGKVITVEKARRGRARTPTPGQYHGPPKRDGSYRPYDPGYRGGRYDREYGRRDRYDDRSYAIPMRDDRRDRYDDRRDRDRDYGYRRRDDYDRRDRYDDYDRRR